MANEDVYINANTLTSDGKTCKQEPVHVIEYRNNSKDSVIKNFVIMSLIVIIILTIISFIISTLTLKSNINNNDIYSTNKTNKSQKCYVSIDYGNCGKTNNLTVDNLYNDDRLKRPVHVSTSSTNNWPWLAAIFIDNFLVCTGVLIHNQFILSDAVSLFNESIDDIRVVIGKTSISSNELAQNHKIDKIIIHELYDGKPYHNNIALIKLRNSVKESVDISKICLPDVKITYKQLLDEPITFTGWCNRSQLEEPFSYPYPDGTYEAVGFLTDERNRDISIKDHYCFDIRDSTVRIFPSCSGFFAPAMVNINEHWSVVGLLSIANGDDNSARLRFTKVPMYLNWIYENIEFYSKEYKKFT